MQRQQCEGGKMHIGHSKTHSPNGSGGEAAVWDEHQMESCSPRETEPVAERGSTCLAFGPFASDVTHLRNFKTTKGPLHRIAQFSYGQSYTRIGVRLQLLHRL